MAATDVLVVSARNVQVATEIETAIAGLDDGATSEFLFDLDKWALTVDDGRETIGLLNGRYEVCVLEAHRPLEWIVGAYDVQTKEFVLAALLRDPRRPDLQQAGALCARALAEPIASLR